MSSGEESRRALLARIPAAVGRKSTLEARRYRVGLDPEAIVERLGRLTDVSAFGPGRFPDLGDPVPAKRFVAELSEEGFRMACVGAHGSERAFGEGGGMLRTLELRGRFDERAGVTEIEVTLVRQRSARGTHRWVGFLVLATASLAWLAMGSGAVASRAVFLGVSALFMSPAFVADIRRAWWERTERLELWALMERTFGPIALDDVEHSPYRNPRRNQRLALSAADDVS